MHLIKKRTNCCILGRLGKNLPHTNCSRSRRLTRRHLKLNCGAILKRKACNVTLLTSSKKVILQRALSTIESRASITQGSRNARSTITAVPRHCEVERTLLSGSGSWVFVPCNTYRGLRPAYPGIEPGTSRQKSLSCCQSRPTLILRVETSSLVPRSSVSYLFARPRRLSLRSPQADRLR